MTFEPGDIAACYAPDWTGRLISLGTASLLAPRGLRIGPSHVALFCERQGEILWMESTTLCPRPCLVRGQPVSGTQAHPVADRIDDYVRIGGRVDLYRLTPLNVLTPLESRLLTSLLFDQILAPGVRYDLPGALLSGTRLFQLSRLFPGADLERLFCSELVAALLMRLGRMNRSNPTRFNPARLLRHLVRTGSYRRVGTFRRDSPRRPPSTSADLSALTMHLEHSEIGQSSSASLPNQFSFS